MTERRTIFGSFAERYDAARPGYPEGIVDAVVATGSATILDVGCGTGKAAEQFRRRSLEVLGIEPDVAMATVARSKGLDVEISDFETWADAGRRFDAVISGQAWHWVTQPAGVRRAARLARRVVAVFWNGHDIEPELNAAMMQVYRREAPELAAEIDATPERSAMMDTHGSHFLDSGLYDSVTVDVFPWDERYPVDRWLCLIGTYSGQAMLSEAVRTRLFEGLRSVIEAAGGVVPVHYTTGVILAVPISSE